MRSHTFSSTRHLPLALTAAAGTGARMPEPGQAEAVVPQLAADS